MKHRNSKAFTLIELLVVIAIIAILAAILFPVFARARENARRATCMSNLKQIGLGIMQYTQDYDEFMPLQSAATVNNFANVTTPSVLGVIQPYIKSWQIYRCPSAVIATSGPPIGESDTNYFTNGVISQNPA